MSKRKFTLTTLTIALSVVLASCSGDSGSSGSSNIPTSTSTPISNTQTNTPNNTQANTPNNTQTNTQTNNDTTNSSDNTTNSDQGTSVDFDTTVPPVTPLPTSLKISSLKFLPPTTTLFDNVNFGTHAFVELSTFVNLYFIDIVQRQADFSFKGSQSYNQMKKVWGTPIPDYSDLALLPKYGEGLSIVFSREFPFENTTIETRNVNKDNPNETNVVNTRLSSADSFTGSNINIGLVSNSFSATVKSSDVFNHNIKTVDLDTDDNATWEYEQEKANVAGVSNYSNNAFVTGASIAGKRNYQANGVVENAQLFVSTISSEKVADYNIPEDTFMNQYLAGHPVAIVVDTFDTASQDAYFESGVDRLTDTLTKSIEKVTANTSITDTPLFIIPTGDDNYNNLLNNKAKFIDYGNTLNGRINQQLSNIPLNTDALLKNPTIAPNLIVVTGAYYDPTGLYVTTQEKFKAKLNNITYTDTDNSKVALNSQDAVTKAATTLKSGKEIYYYRKVEDQTIDDSSNFVKALGSKNCTELTKYYCLAAPADYTSALIDRPNSSADSNNLYDHIFPVTDADQRFKHTDFSTSYAAGQVAAAAAMVKQQFPWFSAKNISTTLLTTATPIGTTRISNEFGWGILNIANALGGPAQFAFGDFVVNFTNKSLNDYKALLQYNKTHNTNAHYAYTSYFTHNIFGDGGLYVYGSKDDTLVLTGINSYKGNTYVLGGNLIVGNPHYAPQIKIENIFGTNIKLPSSLVSSKVYVGANASLLGSNASFGKEIVNDGKATFINSKISCSVTGFGSLSVTGGNLGHDGTGSYNCEGSHSNQDGSKSSKLEGPDANLEVNINANYTGYVDLKDTEVYGNILAKVKDINVTNSTVYGSITSGDTKDLDANKANRKDRVTNASIINSTIQFGLNVSGNVVIKDSYIGYGRRADAYCLEDITLHGDVQLSNSTVCSLNLSKDGTFYFDPSSKHNVIHGKVDLEGKIAVVSKDKLSNKGFIPKDGTTYKILIAENLTGNFSNNKVISDQPLFNYNLVLKDYSKTDFFRLYHYELLAEAKQVSASDASAHTASGFSIIDRNLITASSPVVGSVIAKANTAYDRKHNHLALSASDSNTLALASDLQYYNAAELRSFLVKASAPIYSDAITANAITLNDQYLDFSRKVNANYFNSPDQGKVKAYLSYSFLNNFWNTEFDQAGNSTTSVAGAHSYSTNLKGKQVSNGISAGAYGQFGYYNVGLGVNYLRNSWNEYYADYANVVASQQDLLHNLGQATINTASLMLSASKTTGNYFLGTSIFGNWQGYDVSRSSLAKQDQTAKFNVYGVTVNFNTGFKHLISTHSGFSGQASVAYNYNYHTKFNETASSDLAKVLSYDVKAQGTSLAYANFRAEYFYNFKLFNLNQGINLALGYTLNLFDNANQAITNSVTGVSLDTSNAFTGGNANLLKFGASYHLTLVKDLELDLNASYYTNRYWDGYKGQATLTYSF